MALARDANACYNPHMNIASRNLRVWLIDHRMEQQDFAAQIGTSPSTLSRVIKGFQVPTLALAVKIETETAGEVAVRDWTLPFQHVNGRVSV